MSLRTTWGNLRSVERRLVIGVAVLLFIVVNIVWVWPRFGDWNATKTRNQKAIDTLKLFQTDVNGAPKIKKLIADLEKEGGGVASDDQANNFARAVNAQAVQSSVDTPSSSKPQYRTNEFFLELIQTFSVQSREENLVDFLYGLGMGDSMIRVRDLSLRPDAAHQKLGGNIKLVASYQKRPPVKQAKPAVVKGATKPAPSTEKKTPPPAPASAKKPATSKKL